MRRIFKIILVFVGFFFFAFGKPNLANATITATQNPLPVYANSGSLTLTFTSDRNDEIQANQGYTFAAWKPGANPNDGNSANITYTYYPIQSADGKTLSVTRDNIYSGSVFGTTGSWSYKIWLGSGLANLNSNSLLFQGTYYMYAPSGLSGSGVPALRMDSNIFQANKMASLYILNAQPNQSYSAWFAGETGLLFTTSFSSNQIKDITINGVSQKAAIVGIPVGAPSKDPKKLCLTQANPLFNINSNVGFMCDFSLLINVVAVLSSSLTPTPIQSNEAGIPTGPPPTAIPPTPIAPSPPCSEWIAELSGTPIPIPPDPTGAAAIWQDSKIIKKCASVNTGLGIDIKTDPGDLVKSVFGIILSISGGIALILIIISGYRLIFSQGNPEEVKGAQEQLTSAIVGLLFIIFSLVILQIIGADILKIQGFSK